MGARQREISVSEFFTKNRHLLGFDNPRKALLTCVKEAVDNALDACEEAGILPDVVVKVEVVGERGRAAPGEPGHPLPHHGHRQRPRHRPPADPADLRQAALRLQVPPPAHEPRPAGHRHLGRRHVRPAHDRQARADHLPHERADARPLLRGPDRHQEERAAHPREEADRLGLAPRDPGDASRSRAATRRGGPRSTSTSSRRSSPIRTSSSPTSRPDGETKEYPRTYEQLPPSPREIKPHPYGIELGMLLKMLQDTKSHSARRIPGRATSAGCRRAWPRTSARPRGSRRARGRATSTARPPRRSTRPSRRRRSWRRRPTASRPSARRRSWPASTSRSRATSTRR